MADPGVRRVDALQQRVEVQPAVPRDDDLAVQHTAWRKLLPKRRDHLGEVPGERLAGTAADLDLVAVTEDDRPEAVPLGLVEHAGRMAAADFASIGRTGGITGRSMVVIVLGPPVRAHRRAASGRTVRRQVVFGRTVRRGATSGPTA